MRRIEPFVAGVTVIAGGALLLALGGERQVQGFRVYAPPGDTAATLRVLAVSRKQQFESPLDDIEFLVSVHGRELGRARTSHGGIGELRLAEPLRLPAVVEVSSSVARSQVELRASGQQRPIPSATNLVSRGTQPIHAAFERGAFVAPFTEWLRFDVPSAASLDVTLEGGLPAHTSVPIKDGFARILVATEGAEIQLVARASDGRSEVASLHGTLAPRLGACVLDDRDLSKFTVVCPGVRTHLFHSIYAQSHRIQGGVLTLSKDADGFFRGPLQIPPNAEEVVFSPDASEDSAATIVWPAPGKPPPTALRTLGLSAETLTSATEQEQLRRERSRRWASTVLGLGLAATLLLVIRARSGQLPLTQMDTLPRTNRFGAVIGITALGMLLVAIGVAVMLVVSH